MSAPLCPVCGVRPAEPLNRPFCSERCRMIDLSRWIDGSYRIPGSDSPHDETPDDEETTP
ncbi:MAG: DNA gyrase inhibitor YacG [Desulfuromonadia bacterium]